MLTLDYVLRENFYRPILKDMRYIYECLLMQPSFEHCRYYPLSFTAHAYLYGMPEPQTFWDAWAYVHELEDYPFGWEYKVWKADHGISFDVLRGLELSMQYDERLYVTVQRIISRYADLTGMPRNLRILQATAKAEAIFGIKGSYTDIIATFAGPRLWPIIDSHTHYYED